MIMGGPQGEYKSGENNFLRCELSDDEMETNLLWGANFPEGEHMLDYGLQKDGMWKPEMVIMVIM